MSLYFLKLYKNKGKREIYAGPLMMAKFVRRVDPDNPVKFSLHGFRTCYRRWARKTVHPFDVIELCMGHTVVGEVQGAYLRYDDPHDPELLDEKRGCLEEWSQFCCSTELPPKEQVIIDKHAAASYRSAMADKPLVQEVHRLFENGEASSIWQACLAMAHLVKGTGNKENMARRLLIHQAANGDIALQPTIRQTWQPSSILRRAPPLRSARPGRVRSTRRRRRWEPVG